MKKLVPVYPFPIHPKVTQALPQDGYLYVEALPGGPSPVLAIRKAPPWVCDAIVVMEPSKLAQAVDIVASDGIRMVTVRDTISDIFGVELTEAVGPIMEPTPAQKRVSFS
jgi:hypothetical protein